MQRRVAVALCQPQIHWNTGNVGRTCLGVGAALHLIEPLGFSLDSRQVQRAGLDYWPHVDLTVHESFERFAEAAPALGSLVVVSKEGQFGERSLWAPDARLPAGDLLLLFGNEGRGLRDVDLSLLQPGFERVYIPMSDKIRSFNLSTSVAMVLAQTLSLSP